MSYFNNLMNQVTVLCMTTTLEGAGDFVEDIEQKKLSLSEYVHLLTEIAVRTAGCPQYDPTDAFAFASGLSERTVQIYAPANADQTIDAIKLLTSYMRVGADDFPVDMPAHSKSAELARVAGIWLDVWINAEAQVDEKWKPSEKMTPFKPSKPTPVRVGATPETIDDPAIRAEYEAWLKKRHEYLNRMRSQTRFRQALEIRRDHYIKYFAEIEDAIGEAGGQLRAKVPTIKDTLLKNSFAGLYTD